MRVLLVITGGIAACKTPQVVSLLTEKGHEVRVVATHNGLEYVARLTLEVLSGYPVAVEMYDGTNDREIAHLRLPEWADLVVVVPATANMLAKAAGGIADDLASSVLLGIGTGEQATAPVVFVPSMNTRMWQHLAVQANVATLQERGASIILPASGRLACQTEGQGRMPEPEEIVGQLEQMGLLATPLPE